MALPEIRLQDATFPPSAKPFASASALKSSGS